MVLTDTRAAQIQAHHQAAHAAADKAIEHAKEAGRLLIEAEQRAKQKANASNQYVEPSNNKLLEPTGQGGAR